MSDLGLAVEGTSVWRIGSRHRLELRSPLGSRVVVVVVRWCRLHAVRPGAALGDFEPLYRAGLEVDCASGHIASLSQTDVPATS